MIEFLGRRDYQVKIRGFRIELGEIETVLAQHPMLQEAIVLAREDHPTEKRLVAYVVPKLAQSPPISALRAFLQTRLPEYMIPAAYVRLEKFPLTPHGKVDRQSLPVPDDASYVREGGSATPQTVVEELLAGIWAEVLGLTQVGRQENFFALGGHSLLITRVISRLRQVFQVELPIQSLFEAPTVAALVQRIDTARRMDAPPLVLVGREHALPLSFAQQRLWFLEQLEPVSSLYTISRALRLSGRLNIAALQQALNTIVHRHEALRTTFVTVYGTPVQMIAAHRQVALPVVDLSTRAPADREAEMQRHCTQESQRPFDLAADLMLRATLLQLGAEEHVLLLTLHHIAVDGWSIDVMFRELSVLYDAFSAGKSPTLPELPIQYADFAVWQRQWLAGEVLNTQLAYWRQQLDNAPPLLELPTDRPRPVRQTFRGAQQAVVLPHTLWQSLKVLRQHAGSTLFMTLLAALKVLLHRYTGRTTLWWGQRLPTVRRPRPRG